MSTNVVEREINDELLNRFMKKQKDRKWWSCDLETTTDPNDCRVWHAGMMEIDGKFNNFYETNNFDKFMDVLLQQGGLSFFHNAKFDTSFILGWLHRNGYVYWNENIAKIKKKEHEESGKKTKFNPPIKRYEHGMNSMGVFYSLRILRRVKKNGKQTVVETEIWDSLKKVNSTVKQMAKSYDLGDLLQKGDIDYDKYRPVGYQPDENEISYLRNDVEIVARILWEQKAYGLYGMTNGQDSLTEYKRTIYPYEQYVDETERLQELNEIREENGIDKKEENTYISRCEYHFRTIFPEVTNDMNDYFRESYRGGYTYCDDRFQGKKIGHGRAYDVNSLYPSVMKKDLLPYGLPVSYLGKYEEDEEYPLYLQRVRFGFEIKDNHIPTIQIKGSPYFKHNEYLKSSEGQLVEMHLTSVDWELINEHYDVYCVDYINGFKFKGKVGLFKEFIEHWESMKVNAKTPGERQIAKIMLNTLYGKFGTNSRKRSKHVDFTDDGVLRFNIGEEKIDKPVYTPMACFITAYARRVTITAAQKCYHRFLYADTDSIHLMGEEVPDIWIDSKEFGAWKYEGSFRRAKFIRQKTYLEDIAVKYDKKKRKYVECPVIEADEFELNVKCAGMPQNVRESVTFDNFEVGLEIGLKENVEEIHPQFVEGKGKLKPKQVKGGCVLVEENFRLKAETKKELDRLEEIKNRYIEQNKTKKHIVGIKKKEAKIKRKFRKIMRSKKVKFDGEGFEDLRTKQIAN